MLCRLNKKYGIQIRLIQYLSDSKIIHHLQYLSESKKATIRKLEISGFTINDCLELLNLSQGYLHIFYDLGLLLPVYVNGNSEINFKNIF